MCITAVVTILSSVVENSTQLLYYAVTEVQNEPHEYSTDLWLEYVPFRRIYRKIPSPFPTWSICVPWFMLTLIFKPVEAFSGLSLISSSLHLL